MELVKQWWGRKIRAIATLKIVDSNGLPVQGVTVNGHWEGADDDHESGKTGSTGYIAFSSDWKWFLKSGSVFKFVVDSVSKSGWIYDKDSSITTGQIVVP